MHLKLSRSSWERSYKKNVHCFVSREPSEFDILFVFKRDIWWSNVIRNHIFLSPIFNMKFLSHWFLEFRSSIHISQSKSCSTDVVLSFLGFWVSMKGCLLYKLTVTFVGASRNVFFSSKKIDSSLCFSLKTYVNSGAILFQKLPC